MLIVDGKPDTLFFSHSLTPHPKKRTSDNQLLIRHPDDVKPFQLSTASTNIESNHSYPDLWKPLMEESSEYDGWYYFIPPHHAYVPLAAVPVQQD